MARLSSRAGNTCPTRFSRCPSQLPDIFCCPSGQACLALAGNTTALCCPEGADCDKIRAITCDISQQNASKTPENLIKTTALDGIMGRCGRVACCPFGYSCIVGEICQRNTNQGEAPIGTTTVSASTPVSSSTAAITMLSATPTASQAVSPNALSRPVAGGIAAVAIAVMLVIIVACVCLKPRPTRLGLSVSKNVVSRPLPSSNQRTDFLRATLSMSESI